MLQSCVKFCRFGSFVGLVDVVTVCHSLAWMVCDRVTLLCEWCCGCCECRIALLDVMTLCHTCVDGLMNVVTVSHSCVDSLMNVVTVSHFCVNGLVNDVTVLHTLTWLVFWIL